MATNYTKGSASALPNPALLESAIRRLSRDALADLCEQLIDRLDMLDPDPDLEANGDELDGNNAEDDHWIGGRCNVGPYAAAGCPIADPAEDDDEDCCLAGDDGAHWQQYERTCEPLIAYA